MDQFQQKFIEEATDLINELEDISLKLEKAPDNKEIIERIFRIMHTIKGSSGMFGFQKIDEYTHNLESIYDLIRNGQLKVNQKILEITFASIDHLKLLLFNKDNYTKTILRKHDKLLTEINEFTELEKGEAGFESEQDDEVITSNEKRNKTYYIHFEPIKEILLNGTNPLFLIDELCSLGKAKVILRYKNIPGIKELDPSLCYLSWEIFISTNKGINSIIDVFMFVEEDSKLEIKKISELNLLNEPTFVGILNETIQHEEKVNIEEFIELTRELEFIFSSELEKEDIKSVILDESKQISSIRVSSDKLDDLMNLVSELVTMQARLMLVAKKQENSELNGVAEQINKLSRQLRDIAFSLTLLPIETMLTRFQRLVRDLSKEMNKNIKFETYGTETEIDKSLIQFLIDPILHILRNSIDHGIESVAERTKAGKPKQGSIILTAFYSGANIVIQIKDDGKGINTDFIEKKAIEKGLIKKSDNLNEKEKLNLIFLPGFSTANNVTDVSGRGVGMDVVRRNLMKIRGEVEVETVLGKGSTFTLKIPLTLSIIDGLLVAIEDVKYLIPLSVIEKIHAVDHQKLVNVFNHQIVLDGKQIPFYYLREEFDLPEGKNKIENVIIVKYADVKIGLAFDKVVGEYQAVLKPLGKLYNKLDIFSGATILGDGTVALILDTFKVIQKFSV